MRPFIIFYYEKKKNSIHTGSFFDLSGIWSNFCTGRAKTERTAGRRNKTEADGRYGTWANAGCSQSDFKRGQLFHRRNLKSDFKRRVFVSKRDNE